MPSEQERTETARNARVVAFQSGPFTENDDQTQGFLSEMARLRPDFILTSELFKHPYWACTDDDKFFKWAEPIPGPTTLQFGEIAKELNSNIVVSIFERSSLEGAYYDSAVVLNREGNLVPGVLPDGAKVNSYRKSHIPQMKAGTYLVNEKYYFRPGPGLPVFDTDLCTMGILICYDRAFPEAWRVLALCGAEIVFLPIASAGWREENFINELQVRAMENGLFVVACNKGGREVLEGKELDFFGNSCVVDPQGKVLTKGPSHEGPALVTATIDLTEVLEARLRLPLFRDRRPELYGKISAA